jgi:hypothetical protein
MPDAKKKARADADEFRMAREIEAAKMLREHIAALTEGADADPDLIRDMIEGETSLYKWLDKLVENDARDKEMIVGIKARQSELAERKSRIEKRIETRRTLMLTALQVAELDRHETPDGTLSRRKTPVGCEIVQEADIPADYWRDPAPVLDKAALLAALKDLEAENEAILKAWRESGSNESPKLKTIPGAALKPAGETVAIRT